MLTLTVPKAEKARPRRKEIGSRGQGAGNGATADQS